MSQRLSQFLERIASPAPATCRDRSRTVSDLVSRSAVRPTVNARPSQLDRLEYYSQSQNSCDSPAYSARSQSRQPRYAESVRGNDLDELEILTQPPPAQSRYQAPTRREPRNSMPTRITHGSQQSQESFMHHNDSSRGRQMHTNAAASVRSSSSTVLESPRRRASPLKDIMMSDKTHDFSNFLDSPGSASVTHMPSQRRAQNSRMSSNGTSFVPSSARSVRDVRSHAASTALFDSTSNHNSGTARMNTDTSRSSALFLPTSPAVSVCMSEVNMRHVHGNQPQPRPPAHPVPASTRTYRSISLFGNTSVVPTSAPPKQQEQITITKPHASTTTLLASASRISANSRQPFTPSGGILRTVPLFGNSNSPQSVNASASSNLLSASSRLMEAKTTNNVTSSLNTSATGSNNGEGERHECVTLDDDEDGDDDDDDLPETCATQDAEALLPSPEKKKAVPKPVAQIHSGVDRAALTKELESLKESLVGGLAEMFAKLQEELKSELRREVASSVGSHVAKLVDTENSLSAKVTNAEKSVMAKCTQVERSFTEKLGESQGVLLAKVAESVTDRVDSLGNRIESLKRDIAGVVASQSSQLESTLSAHTTRCVDELSSLSENSKNQMSNLKRSVISLGERVEELKREPPVIRHQVSQSTQTLRVVSPPRAKTSSQSCQTTPEHVTQHASQCVQTDAEKPRRLFLLGTPVKPRRLFILTEPKAQSSTATARQTRSNNKNSGRKVTRARATSKSARKKSPMPVALNTRSRRRITARSSHLTVTNSFEKPSPVNRAIVPSQRRVLTRKKRVVTPKLTREQKTDVPFGNDSASETDASIALPPAKRVKTSKQVVATTVFRGRASVKSNAASEATNKDSLAGPNRGARKKKFSALDPPATPESDAPKQSHLMAESPEFIPSALKPKARSPPSNVWKGRRGRVTATKRTYKKRLQDSKKSPDPQRYLDFGSDVDDKTNDASDTDCSEPRVAVSQTSEQAYLNLIQEMRKGKPASPPKYRVTRKRQHTAPKLTRPRLFASTMEDSDSEASVHDPYASPSRADGEPKSDKRRTKRKTRSSVGSTSTNQTQPRANSRLTRSKANANVKATPVFSPKTWRSEVEKEPDTARRSRRAAKPPARSFMVSF